MKRVVLYASDISLLLGKSLSTGYRVLRDIRISVGKYDCKYVTVDEAANYLRIGKDAIENQLK